MSTTPVLVDAAWAQAHLDDPTVRFVEVDVDTTSYEQSHLPGAVGWNWTSQLADGIRRDIAGRDDFSALLSAGGIGPDTTIVLYGDNNNWFAAWAYWQLKLYGHKDVRILDGGRKYWLDHGLPLSTDVPSYASHGLSPAGAGLRPARLPRRHPAAALGQGARPRRRPRAGRVQRRAAGASRPERDGPAGRPHPRRGVDPVGPDGPRGRHVQERRRSRGALRGQGRDVRQGHHCLLPDRRALVAHLVRPARAARLSPGSQLRRQLDRVGQHGRRADREDVRGESHRLTAARRSAASDGR